MSEQTSSRTRRRIFIISIHAMFGHGLKKLLTQEPDVEVIGHATNIDHALEQLKSLQPDVIILESDNTPSSPSVVLPRLLKEHLGTTVVLLNLHNNQLSIYLTAQWLAKNTDDLIKAIQQRIPASGQAKGKNYGP